MFDYDPVEEQDLLNLLPDGEYDFYVKESEKNISKRTGNLSIKLTLGIYDQRGIERLVFCYLTPAYMFLFKHFADAVGLQEEYKARTITWEICKNLSGRCKIIIEQPEEGSPYMPKNVVKDFLKAEKKPQAAPVKNDFDDSDIPF